MRGYDLGDVTPLRHTVRDADDNLTDATVALTVTAPSGATSTPAVTRTSEGVYDALVESDEAGPWRGVWAVSGAVVDVAHVQWYVAEPASELPPLASLTALGKKLGYTPTDGEAERAEYLLGEASTLIRDVAEKTWVDDDGALTGVPSRVAAICVAAAFRAFGNPEGLTQRSIGDSSKSWDRTGREGGEDVYLTDEEERAVRKAAAGSSFASVTLVSPWSGDDTESLVA